MRVFLFLAIVLSACAQPKLAPINSESNSICPAKFNLSQNCVQIEWIKMPTDSETGIFHFKIFRFDEATGNPLLVNPGGELNVELWMPSMGHGSSPIELEQISVGTYSAKEVFFTMHGEWEIRWNNKLSDGLNDAASLPISY